MIYKFLNWLLGRKQPMFTYTFTPTNGTPVTFTTDAVLPLGSGVIAQPGGGTGTNGGPPPTDPV